MVRDTACIVYISGFVKSQPWTVSGRAALIKCIGWLPPVVSSTGRRHPQYYTQAYLTNFYTPINTFELLSEEQDCEIHIYT